MLKQIVADTLHDEARECRMVMPQDLRLTLDTVHFDELLNFDGDVCNLIFEDNDVLTFDRVVCKLRTFRRYTFVSGQGSVRQLARIVETSGDGDGKA